MLLIVVCMDLPDYLLQDHFSAVTSLSLSPDGWTLLTAGRDKVAILWDLRSHKKLATVPIFEAVEGKLSGSMTPSSFWEVLFMLWLTGFSWSPSQEPQ